MVTTCIVSEYSIMSRN